MFESPDNLIQFPIASSPEQAGKSIAELLKSFEVEKVALPSKLAELIEEDISDIQEGKMSKEGIVKELRAIKMAMGGLQQVMDKLFDQQITAAKDGMIRHFLHNRDLNMAYAAVAAATGRIEEAKEYERKASFITEALVAAGIDPERVEHK